MERDAHVQSAATAWPPPPEGRRANHTSTSGISDSQPEIQKKSSDDSR